MLKNKAIKIFYISLVILGLIFVGGIFKKSLAQTCTGNTRINQQDAEACVNLVEEEGRRRGYNIDCEVQKVNLPFIDPNTGLSYYYNNVCTVNGSSGHGAELLAGYSLGDRIIINPGWDILVKELRLVNTTTQTPDLTDVSAYSGPIKLVFEFQRPNLSLTQNQISILNNILSGLNSFLVSVNNLPQDVRSSLLDSINNLIGEVNKLISLFSSLQVSPSTSTSTSVTFTTTTPTTTPASTTSTTPQTDKSVKGNFGFQIRYIKDDISKSGWVAIREMEFYDENEQKITPVNATASCDWCGYGVPPSYSIGPGGVFDGDPNKVWNAGETAQNCSWYVPHMRDDGIYGVGCSPNAIRTAWIKIDLGTPRNLSKIRIQVMGDATNRVDILQGSTDDKNYFQICRIVPSRVIDKDWIECVK